MIYDVILLTRFLCLTDRARPQAALNESCFGALLTDFDCRFECFASPLNCRYPRYCSAFPDADSGFGR
jgi:hypothetical protein